MPSTSETGHAKNVANFEDLLSFCQSYGSTYNPSRPALQLPALQALRSNAILQQQQAKAARTAFDMATNARQLAFKPLRTLSTRIINAIAASGAGELAVADARTILRKIHGLRAPSGKAKAVTTEQASTETVSKTISVNQQSFDNLIDHLAKLHQLISQQSEYAPNEADLSAAGVAAYLHQLQTVNTSVINCYTGWSNSRVQRDEVLYNQLSGLVQTALSVRLYIKSIYGASSPQYKQVSNIPFRNLSGK